jgi:hypothetical protein
MLCYRRMQQNLSGTGGVENQSCRGGGTVCTRLALKGGLPARVSNQRKETRVCDEFSSISPVAISFLERVSR